jgi:hypothetical protein
MTRSPLAYPLNRSADMDAGGAADLQTDIMRFMAILSLCLVAIFALVQSIPITPTQPAQTESQPPPAVAVPAKESIPRTELPEPLAPPQATTTVEKAVTLTRPKWVPKLVPRKTVEKVVEPAPEVQAPAPALPSAAPQATPPVESETEGFTLRFESDAALTRLVAASHIGLYALETDRAQRMTVSESRISFWNASIPNTFHEMEKDTVPAAVIEALNRTGTTADAVSWGVTLPGKLKTQLDNLMLEHRGGTLIIAASGEIRWEAS